MPDVYIKFARDVVTDALRESAGFDLLKPWVDGVEVTQAIQWYRAKEHLTDSKDQGPDNGITFVAYKPAWVRVYVGGILPHSGVGASVRLQRRNVFGAWDDESNLVQQGYPFVNFDPTRSYRDTRRFLYRTLNFLIPAGEMHGRFRLAVTLTGEANARSTIVTVDATLRQTLRIRGIPIRYWGPDAAGNPAQLGPTTMADFVSTATWPMLTYPVENVPSVSLAGIFTWSESLAGPPDVAGGCSTGWYDLLFWLNVAKVVDGSRPDVLYYGLLPAGTPDGPVIGCDTGGGASSGKVGDGPTMAHEMGHQLGYPHAPCGNVGTPDATYPAYEPYDTEANRTASIGEFGLDVSTGTLYDPNQARDYMSYCNPPWTSLHHYRAQLLNRYFDPRYVASGDRPPWWDDLKVYREYRVERDLPYPQPDEEYAVHVLAAAPAVRSVVVTGMLRDGELDVRSVLQVDARPSEGERGRERLELLDAGGAVVGRAPLRHHRAAGACGGSDKCGGAAGDDCARVVQAVVPVTEDPAAMRIVDGDTVLWTQDAPPRPTAVDGLRADLGGEELRLSWGAKESQETHMRISSDGGESWNLLALRVTGRETTIPLEVVPPGRHLVQALVSDGFHTVVSEPVEIRVPDRPPVVAIHWPLANATVAPTSMLRLWGTGASARGALVVDDAHVWSIDGRPAGTGRDIWVTPPDFDGRHEVALTVRDEHGETTVSHPFSVVDRGDARRRG